MLHLTAAISRRRRRAACPARLPLSPRPAAAARRAAPVLEAGRRAGCRPPCSGAMPYAATSAVPAVPGHRRPARCDCCRHGAQQAPLLQVGRRARGVHDRDARRQRGSSQRARSASCHMIGVSPNSCAQRQTTNSSNRQPGCQRSQHIALRLLTWLEAYSHAHARACARQQGILRVNYSACMHKA